MSELYTLITGASCGIGREFAKEFAKKGNNLVLVARSDDSLKEISNELAELYNIKAFVIPCDLTDADSPKYIYEWCKQKSINIGTLVNNAGVAMFGEFVKLDIDQEIKMIELNVMGLVKLTHYFLPNLVKLENGRILNVSSVASLYPLPYYSIYGATKAFVTSFTEALRFEMRNTNVTISCLCPGDTDTKFFIKAGNRNPKKNMMSPKLVAEIAVSSLEKNIPIIYPKAVKIISRIPKSRLKKIIFKRVSKYRLDL